MRIFAFSMLSFSITHALVYLHVFSGLRKLIVGMSDDRFTYSLETQTLQGFRQQVLGRWIHCHACMGFWVGCGVSFLYGSVLSEILGPINLWVDTVADGFLASGCSFMIWSVLMRIDSDNN